MAPLLTDPALLTAALPPPYFPRAPGKMPQVDADPRIFGVMADLTNIGMNLLPVAEAIRAYLADPNYIKTVAPKTAAAIRAAVNSHTTLSKFIQFNTITGLAAANGIDPAALPIPRQSAPVFSQ